MENNCLLTFLFSPIIVSPSTPAPPTAPDCLDESPNCVYWQRQWGCDYAGVGSLCKKTCNLCLASNVANSSTKTENPAQTPILSDPCGIGNKLLINNSDMGEILSPNYPSNYPDNADCQWHINLSIGYVAVLTFLDFETESHG